MSHPTSGAHAFNGTHEKPRRKPDKPARESAPMLQAALDYHALGWSVVPLCHPEHQGSHPPTHARSCTRPGKQPVRKLIPLRAKPFDRKQLEQIWQRNPALNVGVLTGRVSKLVIVDVDSEDALDAWREFLGVDNVPTWQFASGRGFPHYLYRWDHDFAPRGKPLEGIHAQLDFLGEDMLTVAPPSLHKNGSTYKWLGRGPGSGLALAECPARLVALIRDGKLENRPRGGGISAPPVAQGSFEQVRAAAYLRLCEPAISGAGGRAQTFKVACKIVHGFGMEVEEAVDLMFAEWNFRCQPPWSLDELRREVIGAKERGHCPRIEERHFTPAITGQSAPKPAAAVETLPGRPATQLRRKNLTWLQKPYVVRSTLTLLVGAPNTGKSTFLAHLLSQAKRSMYLPGYEEDPDMNLYPRLEAAGVNLDTVHILDTGDWKMPHARERLCRAVKQHGSDLVVVDPVTSYMAEGASENDAQAVRSLLEGFLRVAMETGAAVVAVRHPGKDPNNVMRGSGAWREVPRNILELLRDQGPPPRHLIQFHKDGYGQNVGPREYRLIGPDGVAKVFTLGEQVGQGDADMLRDVPDQMERLKIDQAAALLACILADGQKESKFVFNAAEVERLSERTVRNAARRIGILITREGQGNDHRSYWSLPEDGKGGGVGGTVPE